jgi:secreted PhoX family phosphatase
MRNLSLLLLLASWLPAQQPAGPAAPPPAPGAAPAAPTPTAVQEVAVRQNNAGETILMLPKGFQYTVFGRKGTIMSDGNVTPSQHDGMAAFASADGDIRIVRNHEVTGDHVSDSKCIVDASNPYAYDHTAPAGCSTIVIDPVTRLLKRDFVSLAGTHTNCAGGATPWGSWLSCEETVFGATLGKSTDGPFGGFAKEHGYVFEVPSQFDIAVKPVPLKALGRFVHEAIAIDPRTGILYLTEDRKTAGFYRFIPNNRRRLQEGGQLEMLMIDAKPGFDTRKGQRVGDALVCKWVSIDDPDPVSAATNDLAVYESGKAKGAATFARLEGAWFGNGSVYMSATSGGDAGLGQVWRYIPSETGGTLVLLFESRDKKVLWSPDNLTVSRRGGIAGGEPRQAGHHHPSIPAGPGRLRAGSEAHPGARWPAVALSGQAHSPARWCRPPATRNRLARSAGRPWGRLSRSKKPLSLNRGEQPPPRCPTPNRSFIPS